MALTNSLGINALGNEAFKQRETNTGADNGVSAVRADYLESVVDAQNAAVDVAAESQILVDLTDVENRLVGLVEDINSRKDGLTQSEAAILSSQISQYNSTVPANLQINFPANESFDGSSRVTQTRLGFEAATDKLKEAGEWLMKQLETFIESIQKFLTKTFGTAERLLPYLQKLEEKADSVEIEDAKRKIEIPVASLRIGKGVPDVAGLKKLASALASATAGVTSEGKLVEDVTAAAVKAADKDAADIVKDVAEDGETGKAVKAYAEAASPLEEKNAIGGRYVKTGDNRTLATIADKPAKDKVEIVILTPADVKAIVKDLIKVAEFGIDSRKLYGDTKKVKTEIGKAAKGVKKAAESAEGTDQKAAVRKLTTLLRKAGTQSAKGVPQDLLALLLSTAGTLAGICDKSLK